MSTSEKNLLVAACLLVLTFAVYARTTGFGFVWDDHQLVEQNPLVQGEGSWARIWTTGLFQGVEPTSGALYRPLVVSSLRLNRLIGDSPISFHLTNVLLHALTALLAFLAAVRLGAPRLAALIGALVFALWSGQSEAVAWIAGRADLLLGLGVALAVLGLSGEAERVGGPLSLVLLWTGVLVAGLSKEPGLVIGAVIALAALSRTGLRPGQRVLATLAVLLAVALAVGLRVLALGPDNLWVAQLGDQSVAGRLARLGTQLFLLGGFDMRVLVAVPQSGTARLLSQIGGGAGLGVAAVAAAWAWRRYRIVSFLVGVAVAAVLTVSAARLPALRYLYVPVWALSVTLALLLTLMVRRVRPRAAYAVCAALICAWAAMGQLRLGAWHSDDTLFAVEAAQNPDNPDALFLHGMRLLARGDKRGAIERFEYIVREQPGHRPSWLGLTRALLSAGQPLRAERAIRTSLRGRPQTYPQFELLGHTLAAQGRWPEALEAYQAALQQAPRSVEALTGARQSARKTGDHVLAGRLTARLAAAR